MPIVKQKDWEQHVKINDDPYGKCCVDVAREVMLLLDKNEPFNAHDIVHEANHKLKAGISGYMAGCVASMIAQCHSRGEEFRKQWNKDTQLGTEGEEANKKEGTVLNPALINIGE